MMGTRNNSQIDQCFMRGRHETEDLLVSITKKCQTLIEQTHRKAEETLELKTIRPRGIFHFNPPIQIERSWMTGLINLEVYYSVFNVNTTNIGF